MEKEPSTRPGNQLDSVLKLTHVDQITQDLAAVLKEIHESINSSDGNVRDCSARLKSYIKISLKAVERIHREIEESIKLTGNRKFSQEKQSRDRADFRNAEKRADRLSGKESKKRKSDPLRRLEQNVLGKNALNDGTKRAKRDLPTRKQKKRATAVADLGDLPRPQNGEIYTLKELVSLMCIEESSSIFRKSVTSVYNMLYAKCEIVCDYRTLARAIKTYKDTGLLPRHGSEGSRMGRPPLVATNQIHLLNEDVKKHTSKVESARELSGKIVELNTSAVGDEECGYEIVSPPSRSTLKTYHYLASAEKGITLTSKSGSRLQGARRQAAGTSLRNLMSHVCTVAETHFVEGSFEEPTGLSSGAKKMLALVKSVTGVPHRPIKPYQVLNFDFSSYFTWKGTVTEKEGTSNEWVRVSTKTLARGVRNRRGPFRDSEETKCNGLTVKWCDGAAASGHIFPMVALFSGFSEEELPKDSFLVLEVPGMNINANLDVRMADTHVRYICLKRTDVSMERFFEWYEEEIIYPMVSELRRAHSLLELHSEGAPVPLSKAARVWTDSDMARNFSSPWNMANASAQAALNSAANVAAPPHVRTARSSKRLKIAHDLHSSGTVTEAEVGAHETFQLQNAAVAAAGGGAVGGLVPPPWFGPAMAAALAPLTATVNGHTGILNAHTAALNALIATVNGHTGVLNGHTGVLNGHTAALNALTTDMAKVSARVANGVVNSNADPLQALPSPAGALPQPALGFPATLGHLHTLNGMQLNGLLLFYQLGVGGTVEVRRHRFMQYIGIRP